MPRIDEEIKKDVVDELYWDGFIDASQVSVIVSDGVVTLSGQVPTYSESTAAWSAAHRIQGVLDVVNDINISYVTPPEVPDDAEIERRANTLLRWDPSLDDATLSVSVNDGIITLDGTVDAYWKKSFIEGKIMDIRGIVYIENKLTVVPSKELSDEIIAEDIVSAMDRDTRVDAEDITIKVEDGVVRLSGQVVNWRESRAAVQIATRTAGVVGVDDDIQLAA